MGAGTGTFTDLYEFTMVQSYLEHGVTGPAVFDLHVRSLPSDWGYLVAAGLARARRMLDGFEFTDAELRHLAEQGLSGELLDYLDGFEFTGTIRALPEGTPVFPYEPIVQVEAPLPEAQIVETVLLNAIHVETLLASKAARSVVAADGRTLVDFGARRAHGRDAARAAARCAYLAGFDATSLVEAARELGIPCVGTMAHAYVLAFPTERDALEAFARSFPDGTTLLIDTYDTVEGARTAVRVARDLAADGVRIGGVRLDSGDLADLAKQVRQILDEGGLEDVWIVASGGLDEHAVDRLAGSDLPIDGFGVGTSLVVSRDSPALDVAYKLAVYDDEPVMKLSTGKRTLPGAKQVFRRTEDGTYAGDVLGLQGEDPGGEPLLGEVEPGDARDPDALQEARSRFAEARKRLPERLRRLRDPDVYPVERSDGLEALVEDAQPEA